MHLTPCDDCKQREHCVLAERLARGPAPWEALNIVHEAPLTAELVNCSNSRCDLACQSYIKRPKRPVSAYPADHKHLVAIAESAVAGESAALERVAELERELDARRG